MFAKYPDWRRKANWRKFGTMRYGGDYKDRYEDIYEGRLTREGAIAEKLHEAIVNNAAWLDDEVPLPARRKKDKF